MEKHEIDRINELARKKKTVGLTAAEVEEQAALRKRYIAEFRESLREDGSYKKLEQKKPLN